MAPLRTLVCVLAETRAWRRTWPSFKTNVLDALGADLALCIGMRDDYDRNNPFWQTARYRWTSPEHDDYGEGFDAAQRRLIPRGDRPAWRKVLEVKDHWLGGIRGDGQQPGSGAILIYFRWLLLEHLRASGALQSYDRFVITRSDFVWLSEHPGLDILTPESLWVPDGENYGGVTDRHTVLTRDDVELYLDMMSPIVCDTDRLITAMNGRTNWNLESYIKHHLVTRGAFPRVRVFPYIMHSVREKDGSTSWSKGVWNEAQQCYIKYPSEYAASTFWRHVRHLFGNDRALVDWVNKGGWLSAEFEAASGSRHRVQARLARGDTAQPSLVLGVSEKLCHVVITGYRDAMLIVDAHGHLVRFLDDCSVRPSRFKAQLSELLELRAAGRIPHNAVARFGYSLRNLKSLPAQGA